MSEQRPGTIGWADLRVNDAEELRDFYAAVTGWVAEPLDMGRYAVIRDPAGAVAALFESARA